MLQSYFIPILSMALAAFAPLANAQANETHHLPDDLEYRMVDGVRFYPEFAPQPWRNTDDVIEGFDWSLPPEVKASPHATVFQAGANPKNYPARLLGKIATNWRALEPKEGQFDFSPITSEIEQLTAAGYRAIELHVRGSVFDVEHFDGDGNLIPPQKLNERQARTRKGQTSAPAWLAAYSIPTLRGKPQSGTDAHIVNYDIFHPEYHSRYLKMVSAFACSGIPRIPELAVVYVHMVSFTPGEENDGAFPGDPGHPQMVERIEAWAEAFPGNTRKLMFTGHHPENLRIAYSLGMGQRTGYVERYLLHTHNPSLGQRLDAGGYLHVDESLPPIMDNRVFGDQNEEYQLDSDVHVIRFGPRDTWPHRYREATFRQLQMRRNYAWEPPSTPDPHLSHYFTLQLARTVEDAPDAWCYLRESHVREGNLRNGKVVPVKNFERWLMQRDKPGYETEAVKKVTYPEPTEHFIKNVYADGHNHDFVARKGMNFGFSLDGRFTTKSVAVKVTYYDEAPWKLIYQTPGGTAEVGVKCRADGKLRTATFFLKDAVFPAKGTEFDFVVRATKGPATLRFVRVVRLD